ncbi:hypothetical protein RI129_011308 [Pyrocoelia pectoralis]|uniref:Ionotropic glutamate receptor C-terminal domain-containing protein n=1 Tax=Pyrocoelia pectoralis TaxID=417401 RepID=A0AAN7V3T8_9COLE
MRLLLVILVAPVWCKLEPPEPSHNSKSLSQCLGAVTENFFKVSDLTMVQLASGTDGLLLSEMFRFGSLIIGSEHRPKQVDNYLIEVTTANDTQTHLEELKGYQNWNYHAKFLVFSTSSYKHPGKVAKIVVEQLQAARVVNGAVLLIDPHRDGSYLVYSWYPFAKGRSGVQIVDVCVYGVFANGTNWFSGKIPRNLHGYPVKVRPIVWPPYVLPPVAGQFKDGVEIKLLELMAQVGNFSIEYLPSNKSQDWGTVLPNGTAFGSISFLKRGECDILMGSIGASNERHAFFDYVSYNFPESLTWCVPHARDTYQWIKLVMVLPQWATVATYATCVTVGVLLWTTGYCNLPESLQIAFAVLHNVSVRFHSRRFKARALFIIWTLFALHITTIYQAFLISVLTKPIYKQEIQTLTDIFDHNLDIWIMWSAKRYFNEQDDGIDLKIRTVWKLCEEIDDCLYDTVVTKKSATCTPRHFIKYAVSHYVTENGEPLLYCFPDSIVTYPVEMLMTKAFPLTDYFRALVPRISAAGLMLHWEKQIFEFHLRNSTNRVEYLGKYGVGIEDLLLIFGTLLFGHFCAFLVFLLELYTGRRLKRK